MTTAPHPASSAASKRRLVVGTAVQFGWLNGIVKAVLVMNLLDAILTLLWVRAGFAIEANLLLREIVDHHAILFVVGKLGLVSLGTALLWRRRTHPVAVVGIFLVFLAYYLILLYHFHFASILIKQLI